MVLHIAALVFIFGSTSIAWMILGATIQSRTRDSSQRLGSQVASTWGGAMEQQAPTLEWTREVPVTVEERGASRKVMQTVRYYLPISRSDVGVQLDLEHRQKGLLWYSTYQATFLGDFDFVNDSGAAREMVFVFPYPAKDAVYDDVQVVLEGSPLGVENTDGGMRAKFRMMEGARARVQVRYRSQGLETWRYKFGSSVTQVRDFRLRMLTNFAAVDFPENTLSPTSKKQTGSGWELEWRYRNLVSGFPIAMRMPEKLQPGPLAGQISFFAPVSLFFFLFVMFLIATLRRIALHPMHYFFLAAAFFAFHLLLAYLVDHVSIHVAFAGSAVVSMGLVISYLRLVVGTRFAFREAGIAQLVYLVLFSYAFFFKGYTGLAVTIGAIVTLFVAMQTTARVRWAEDGRFGLGLPAKAAPTE